MSDLDTLVVTFQTQLWDVMETVIETAMFKVTRLVKDCFLEEVKRRRQEVENLRVQLQVAERKLSDRGGTSGRIVDCAKDDVEMSSEPSDDGPKEHQEDTVENCGVKAEEVAWTSRLGQEETAETTQAGDSHSTEKQTNEEEVAALQTVDVKEEVNRPSCSWSGTADSETEPESHSTAEMTKTQPKQTQMDYEKSLRTVIKQEPQILTAYVFPEEQKETHMDTDQHRTFDGDSSWAGLTNTAAGLQQNCRLEPEKDCDAANTTQPEAELSNSITADANVLLAQRGDQVLCSRLQNSDELGVTIKQEVTVNYDICAERKHKEKTMRKLSTTSLLGSLKQQRPSLETFKQNRFSHKATVQEVMRLHSKVDARLRLQAALQHLHRPMKRSPHTLSSDTTALSLAQAANKSRIASTSKATPAFPLSAQRGQLGDRQAAAHNRTGAPWVSGKTQLQSANSHHIHPLPHQDSHSSASPRQLLRCGQCGKSFPHPSNLKAHLQTHTGERPFCCSLCGRSFTKLSNLKAHRRVHTGERPYCCLACGKSFTQKCNLKRHQRIHLDV